MVGRDDERSPYLFTVAEASEELGVTPEAIRYAVHRGIISAVPLHKRTNLIPRSKIERYKRDHLRQRGPGAVRTAKSRRDRKTEPAALPAEPQAPEA